MTFLNPWAVFYGVSTLIAIILALGSKRHAPLQCGLLLLTDWFITCIAESFMGYDTAPLVIAPTDAVIAICILMVALANRCPVGYRIFGLYMIGGIIHVYAYIGGTVGNRTYYEALNVVYFLSVVCVGWDGAKERLDRWSLKRHRVARASIGRR